MFEHQNRTIVVYDRMGKINFTTRACPDSVLRIRLLPNGEFQAFEKHPVDGWKPAVDFCEKFRYALVGHLNKLNLQGFLYINKFDHQWLSKRYRTCAPAVLRRN